MVRRYTILLLIPHLGGGGAERVMSHLARSLPCDLFDVHLGIVTPALATSEKLPACVHVHNINAGRVLYGTAGIVRIVRKIRPDLVLSGMFHLNILVLLLRPLFPRTTQILVRQNGMLSGWRPGSSRLGRLLYRLTYRRADGIVGQTRAMADELKQLIGSRTPVHILRNPVDIESIRETAARQLVPWSGLGPHLLAIGRLSHEKGFDLLLDAFAAVRKEYPGANLTILGEGAERSSLRSKGDGLGLTASVRLAGYVREPAAWFAGATLLVIPSRCEALPNALLEGAAAGLPIVATPCSSGMEDLIDGRAGIWLARDISSEALARSLKAALVTLRPGERFEHSWLAPFDLPNAVAGYRNLILETLTGVSG